ncbi:MAG: GTP 3',8-cyclase MoaA [Phycisphaerales bacterium]|nr:GTP 3',8-cyclase MoaA [Phycisphaerales bacterium]
MLTDRFGRTIDYLRLSVIDHCNLRCVYCMPLSGLRHSTGKELLTPDEIECVVRAAADAGFRRVRITGGEPTLRAELVEIVWRVAAVPGIEEVAMTTNGVLLPRMVDDLADAGLKRVNLHIDTLDPERFKRLMRFGTLREAWAGLESAIRAGLKPIKINAVITRGYNDMDVVDLAELTIENDWHVRFIELMPLGGGECAQVARDKFVSSAETRGRIEAELGVLTPVPRRSLSDESINFKLPGARGEVGFISPVSEPYCDGCNRMRLTADGKFHLCLLHDDELDVRKVLRSGGGQEAVEALLRRAVAEKPSGHQLADGVSTLNRNMIQVGG